MISVNEMCMMIITLIVTLWCSLLQNQAEKEQLPVRPGTVAKLRAHIEAVILALPEDLQGILHKPSTPWPITPRSATLTHVWACFKVWGLVAPMWMDPCFSTGSQFEDLVWSNVESTRCIFVSLNSHPTSVLLSFFPSQLLWQLSGFLDRICPSVIMWYTNNQLEQAGVAQRELLWRIFRRWNSI